MPQPLPTQGKVAPEIPFHTELSDGPTGADGVISDADVLAFVGARATRVPAARLGASLNGLAPRYEDVHGATAGKVMTALQDGLGIAGLSASDLGLPISARLGHGAAAGVFFGDASIDAEHKADGATEVDWRETARAWLVMTGQSTSQPDVDAYALVIANRDRADWNASVLRRLSRLATADGGGVILVPGDLVYADGRRVPLYVRGPVDLTTDAELRINGLVKVPDGAFGEADEKCAYAVAEPGSAQVPGAAYYRVSDTAIRNAPGCRRMTVSGTGVFDGNWEGSIGSAAYDLWIDEENDAADCSVGGLTWNTVRGRDTPDEVVVRDLTVQNCLRNCVGGSGSYARILFVKAYNSATDHCFYLVDGDGQGAIHHNVMIGCVSGGYFRASMIDLNRSEIFGHSVTHVTANPVSSYGYPAQPLGALLAVRPYRGGTRVRGFYARCDLELLAGFDLFNLRAFAQRLEVTVEHTGDPDAYLGNIGQTEPGGPRQALYGLAVGANYRGQRLGPAEIDMAFVNVPSSAWTALDISKDYTSIRGSLSVSFAPTATGRAFEVLTVDAPHPDIDLSVDVRDSVLGGGAGRLLKLGENVQTGKVALRGHFEHDPVSGLPLFNNISAGSARPDFRGLTFRAASPYDAKIRGPLYDASSTVLQALPGTTTTDVSTTITQKPEGHDDDADGPWPTSLNRVDTDVLVTSTPGAVSTVTLVPSSSDPNDAVYRVAGVFEPNNVPKWRAQFDPDNKPAYGDAFSTSLRVTSYRERPLQAAGVYEGQADGSQAVWRWPHGMAQRPTRRPMVVPIGLDSHGPFSADADDTDIIVVFKAPPPLGQNRGIMFSWSATV